MIILFCLVKNWVIKDTQIFCGFGKGVMEAISKGANMVDGLVIGISKGQNTKETNDYLSIPTGIGIA
tara:strand:- start:210 stop:410 length:201 start_codon:yes stop_codon:yes gene_type:complete